MTLLYDRATIKGQARITPQGYFVADALVAKANNIQDYYARELGLTDRDPNAVVRVFRPESEVFAVDSLESAVRLPITLDHPPVMVDSKNWREYARGETDGAVLRDGEFLRVPLRVTDEGAVQSVLTDRQEFSLGYDCNLKFETGMFDGQAYDAVATDLRYNHLAACRTARGGPQLRIVDERPPVPTGGQSMPFVIIDGMPVDPTNAAAAETALVNLRTARDTALQAVTDSQTALTTANGTIAARDAEIATLKDQLANAKPTPQALRDAAATFAKVADQAKRLGATVTDGMDEPAMKAAAVKHKVGDAKFATYSPEQVAIAFDMLVDGLADTAVQPHDSLRDVIATGPAQIGDAATEAVKARDARQRRFETAYLGNRASAQ